MIAGVLHWNSHRKRDFSNNPNRIRVLVQVYQRDLYKQKWLKMLVWVQIMDLYEHPGRG